MLFRMYKSGVLLNLSKYFINRKLLCRSIYTDVCKYSVVNDIDRNLFNNYIKHIQQEYDSMGNSNVSDKLSQKLSPLIQIINERERLTKLLDSTKELSKDSDEEMKKLVLDEVNEYEHKIIDVENELIELVIPSEKEDACNSIVLEVNAGVGGQEAMLFAKEIFDMYWNFAHYKGWSCELAECNVTDLGGLRHASIFVDGDEAYKYFKHEVGVHRVQRIPVTEKGGRVHTSTVSVVALPQPKDIDIKIPEKDLKIETKRSTGAGGQHVNTTDSAVRIIHLPTGTAVECQVSRSQIKNRQIAHQKLRALLYERQLNEQIAESEALRKSQVRSNFRNEKIRTYNFSQDRITDHRIQGNFHNLKVFLTGGEQLESLINKLSDNYKMKQLMNIISK